jgi:hypothetical protein
MTRIQLAARVWFGVILLSLAACGGGGGSTTTPPAVIQVTISGPTGSLTTGTTRTFTASVNGTSNTAVTWSVVEAGGGTITASGVYTAPTLPGTYTIKATAQADGVSSSTVAISVVLPLVVQISGPTGVLNTGTARTFTASVSGTSNTAVTWSVVEAGGGTITTSGVYTAPALPGTFTVKATALADGMSSATTSVPVVLPEGHIAGYDVGADYHATGADFVSTAFISQYDTPAVRQTVRTQLQGMADRGATLISTRIWLTEQPGTVNIHGAWVATFPMTAREQANLRAFATDVAAVVGSGGNRLRLTLGMLWLGAADYTMGSPTTTLGFFNLSAAEFTRRVEATTDSIIAAVTGINRPDGVPIVDIIYLNGEVQIAAPTDPQPAGRPNDDWFMKTHYPRFVQAVQAAGFTPSVYFIFYDTQAHVLDPGYIDSAYPELNGHRSAYWLYRTLHFMKDNGLPLPARIDFSYYPSDLPLATGVSYPQLLQRTLDDADAVLPLLGIAQPAYGIAETWYLMDDVQRHAFGQSFAAEAGAHTRLHTLTFWTAKDAGGPSVNVGYPFAIEDFLPPP